MVDRYTKGVLTVIAICLVVIAVRGTSVEKAAAALGPLHVTVDEILSQPINVHCENCQQGQPDVRSRE
jgi:hypothetical protein